MFHDKKRLFFVTHTYIKKDAKLLPLFYKIINSSINIILERTIHKEVSISYTYDKRSYKHKNPTGICWVKKRPFRLNTERSFKVKLCNL